MEVKTEDKIFAPGYGEFYTADGSDVEALALAVPTDALPGPLPDDLRNMYSGALDTFDAAKSKDWKVASAAVDKMNTAWETYKTGEVPKRIEPCMNEYLAVLTEAVGAHDGVEPGPPVAVQAADRDRPRPP